MSDEDQILFETYKLHAELAERVAALREGLNKLYTGMVTSIVAASVLMHRLLPNAEAAWVFAVLGIVVALSWMFSFHSVTLRLSAKHDVLVELEGKLPFTFFDKENRLFNKSGFWRRKYSGMIMPIAFLMLSGAWLTIVVMRNHCSP